MSKPQPHSRSKLLVPGLLILAMGAAQAWLGHHRGLARLAGLEGAALEAATRALSIDTALAVGLGVLLSGAALLILYTSLRPLQPVAPSQSARPARAAAETLRLPTAPTPVAPAPTPPPQPAPRPDDPSMSGGRSEMLLARDIQKMMPGGLATARERWPVDVAAVCEPARTVGGDLYDLLELRGGRMGLLIGDVSGKGMGAAIFMALAKTWLAALAAEQTSPAEVLNQANVKLCQNNDACMFVTVFFAILDTTTGELVYANAGHDAPLVVSAGGLEEIPVLGDMALGIDPQNTYRDRKARIRSGDTLFLYTDGVTDATNSAGERFSEERLRAVLTQQRALGVEPLVRSVVDEVKAFVLEARKADDLTVLAVRWPRAERVTG